MNDLPIPFAQWKLTGESYPTTDILYSWTRPSSIREELLRAGVIGRVNNRWFFNPPKWREHCANQFRKSNAA